MELGAAVDTFRLHHQGIPNEILYNLDPQIIPPLHLRDALRKIGHNLKGVRSKSVVQAIYKDGDKIYAKADFKRKGGTAEGF